MCMQCRHQCLWNEAMRLFMNSLIMNTTVRYTPQVSNVYAATATLGSKTIGSAKFHAIIIKLNYSYAIRPLTLHPQPIIWMALY